MTNLHDNQIKFNSTMVMSHTGGCLSSDSGLVLMKEIMDTLQLSKLTKQLLHIEDKRNYYTHDNVEILEQLILQLTAWILRTDWTTSA